jgi:hypothetical protein
MFWKRFDIENAGDDADVRLYLRQQVLNALEFATLGAYELLPAEPAARPADVADEQAERAIDPVSPVSHERVEPAPSAEHETASDAPPVATVIEDHARAVRRDGHTSMRPGSRCNSERPSPCAIAMGEGTASSRRRLHAVRRSRRPGRPAVREQPCTWAAWLADRQA